MIRVEASRPSDWAALGAKWRALEERCGGSFFQGWTWVGCMAEARYPDPLLLEAYDGAELSGLALFNRRGRRLHLSESGDAVLDGVTIEHNGVLALPGRGDAVRAACLRAARGAADGVALSGIGADDARAAEATGLVRRRMERPAPRMDLAALRDRGLTCLDAMSANTRYQIRRAERDYARHGPVAITRARSAAEAHAHLNALVDLHTRRWESEGKPGAFAAPPVMQFHRELIDRGFERDEIDLWRVSNGVADVGYLYNFKYHGAVMAYQSGFAAATGPHAKPGMVCHALAMEIARKTGISAYDFLAGDHRYKISLASGKTDLYWVTLIRRGSGAWFAWKFRDSLVFLKYSTTYPLRRRGN